MSVMNATATTGPTATSIPLLTFGILSSCLHLPALPVSLSIPPLSADLGALAVTQSCAFAPGFMVPKYEPHLTAVRQFVSQLNTLLASTASNSTAGFTVPMTAPQTLPLWMGLSLFVLILFQFVLMLLFVVSEAPMLIPSLAARSKAGAEADAAADVLKTPAVTRHALTLQRGLTPLLMPATAVLIALSIGVNTKFPSTPLPAVVVLTRTSAAGSNTSKLWLCVMAEAAIWFISRRRIRQQVALEHAKTAVWKQITASGFVLLPASSQTKHEKTEATAIDIPAPIYSPQPPTHTPATTLPSAGDDQSLSWRLVGDTSGKLYN